MKYLEHINAFHKLMKQFGANPTVEEVALIFNNTYRKSFKKGEIILKQGDVCNEAYFIVKGIVRSYNVLPNGTEKTYIICREHNIFNEHSSFMSRKPSTDYLEAIEDTEVFCVTYESLLGLYDTYHTWATIGRKISDTNYIVSLARLKSLMNDDAEKRYKRYLKSFQNILDRIPQNVAASYIGITPQSFSRLKRELESKPKESFVLNNNNDFSTSLRSKIASKPIHNADELGKFHQHILALGADVSFNDLSRILPYISQKTFKKGEFILKVGEICRDYYFSMNGLARIFHQLPNGTEKTYYLIPEFTIFLDYASLISQTPATENIEAIDNMNVYCISYEGVMDLASKHFSWETISRVVTDTNFTFSQKRLRSMMNDDASTRYRKFLKHYELVNDRIPQNVIASYLGITPQSLSRLKKEMDVL